MWTDGLYVSKAEAGRAGHGRCHRRKGTRTERATGPLLFPPTLSLSERAAAAEVVKRARGCPAKSSGAMSLSSSPRPACLPPSSLLLPSFLPSFAHGPVPRWTLHTTGPHGQNPPPLGRSRPHTARQGIPTSASELFGCERASAPPGREDSGERPALRGRGSSAPLRACACVTASPAAATAAVHPRPYKKIIIIFLQTAGGGARRAPPSPCFSLLSCCYS